MKSLARWFFLFLSVVISAPTLAQTEPGRLDTGISYTHQSGNNGLNGFSPTVGFHFNRYVTLMWQGDFLWNTSRIGVFDLSQVTGAISTKSNFQSYLGGGRVRFRSHRIEEKELLPFLELQLGESRLHQSLTSAQGNINTADSDTAFTYVLGGGVDYPITPHWLARGNLDLVRTHFVNSGQSHARFNIGIVRLF